MSARSQIIKKDLFDVPHPWLLMIAGVVFIVLGAALGPALGAPGRRAVIDPFTQFAPPPVVVVVMCAIGLWFICQGVVTLIRRRR